MVNPLTYLISIPAEGESKLLFVPDHAPFAELIPAMLHTDVTERLRLAAQPEGFPEGAALCYFIDARGGEKALPANFTGTCFYHTGCPIYGDLILAKCSVSDPEGEAEGFTEAEAGMLRLWLKSEFNTAI